MLTSIYKFFDQRNLIFLSRWLILILLIFVERCSKICKFLIKN